MSDTVKTEISDQFRDSIARRFELFAKYKELGSEIRKVQASIARIDAELVKSGFTLSIPSQLW